MPTARVAPLLVGAVALVLGNGGCTCGRRVHLTRGDGSPAVVVVDPDGGPDAAAAAAALPTVDETEPNNRCRDGQVLELGAAVRGLMHPAKGRRGDYDYFRITVTAEMTTSPGDVTGGGAIPGASPSPSAVSGRDSLGGPGGGSPGGGATGPAAAAAASQGTASGSQPAPVPRAQVSLSLSGVPGVDLRLEVFNDQNDLLQSVQSGKEGEPEAIPNLALSPGTYCVRVRQAGRKPKVDTTHHYTLATRVAPLPPGEELEPNGRSTWATPLPLGAEITGYLGWRRDLDWYRVDLEGVPEGGRLRVDYRGVPGVTAAVAVSDSLQSKLHEARGAERIALRAVQIKAKEPAYFVSVRAVSGHSQEMRYALRVSVDLPGEPTEVEPNNDPAHATPLSETDGAVAGYIVTPGDVDWFRLIAPTPSLARVEVTSPERIDIKLAASAQDGRELWRVDEGGLREPEIVVGLSVRGSVLLKVYGRRRDSNADLPYRLTWQLTPDAGGWEREPNNTVSSAGGLGGGLSKGGGAAAAPASGPAAGWGSQTTVQGYLHPRGDVDHFLVTAPPGAPSRLRASLTKVPVVRPVIVLTALAAPSGGSARADGGAEARAPSGEIARSRVAGETVSLDATLTPGRRYLIAIKDVSGKASNPRDAYRLTVVLTQGGGG